ncbi:Zinc finger and BTB domain-containing protein 24 [Trichoplax sp. H2]|nr:Zinc finger and BTB domain-containing protein 24 [Trichoplax sp. H2]|eukprot:RDD44947.1 Zinc finger and BTB domain-containing protein 24 [Trichoplax sp. H2]
MITEYRNFSNVYHDDNLSDVRHLCNDFVGKESQSYIHRNSRQGINVTCSYCKMKFVHASHFLNHLCQFHDIDEENAKHLVSLHQQDASSKSPPDQSIQPIIIEDDDDDDIDDNYNGKMTSSVMVNKIKCRYCNKLMLSVAQLKRHVQQHTGIKSHRCKICGKTFKSYCNYRKHTWTHRQSGIQCPECHRYFKSEKTLRSHSILHSTQVAIYCSLCHRSLKNLSGFKIHLKKLHKELSKTEVKQLLEQAQQYQDQPHLDKRQSNSENLINIGVVNGIKRFKQINQKVTSPLNNGNESSQIALEDDGEEIDIDISDNADDCYQKQMIKVKQDADTIQLKIRKQSIDSCHDRKGATIVVNENEINYTVSPMQRDGSHTEINSTNQARQFVQEISQALSRSSSKIISNCQSKRQGCSTITKNSEVSFKVPKVDAATLKKSNLTTAINSNGMFDTQDFSRQIQRDCQDTTGELQAETELKNAIPQHSMIVKRSNENYCRHSNAVHMSYQDSTTTETNSQYGKSVEDNSSCTEQQLLSDVESETDIENDETDSVLNISWSWIHEIQSQLLGNTSKEEMDIQIYSDSDWE